jgi:hypothetical protein
MKLAIICFVKAATLAIGHHEKENDIRISINQLSV